MNTKNKWGTHKLFIILWTDGYGQSYKSGVEKYF